MATQGLGAEICDRCSVPAAYRVAKGKAELYFCSHHARISYKGLTAKGWTFYPDNIHVIAPQGKL